MKNYLVVGGSSGIGERLVTILEERGHTVYSTYHTQRKESFGQAHYYALDVLEDNPDLSFLPEHIDGFVYCPGRINLKPFHRFKDHDFIEDYQVQVIGAVKILRKILPKLKKSDSASVVFFSTVAVQKGFNFHSLVAASKGAMEGMTKALAAEFAPAIRVNAIAPSLTDTPLAGRLLNTPEKKAIQANKNPMKRIGTPDDIAQAAAFLLSSESSWMTGQILHIDGGFSSLNV